MALDLPKDDTDYPPFYTKETVYAITINPNDKWQGNTKHDHDTIAFVPQYRWTRLNQFRKIWHDNFIHLHKNGIDHFLWLELSEVHERNSHDSVPRLHFHGYIRFRTNDSIKFWLLHTYEWLSSKSNVLLKNVTDYSGWNTYCTKFQHIMNTPPMSNMADLESLVPHTLCEAHGVNEVPPVLNDVTEPGKPVKRSRAAKRCRKAVERPAVPANK